MSKIVDLTGLSRFWSNVDKKKASIDGTYPDLVAGDLAGRGESVPASFGFRASGGKSIKDGRAYIKRIKGNSVVWNNIAEWRGVGNTNYGITVTFDNGYIHVQGVAENTTIPFYSVMYDDAKKPGKFIKNHRYMVSGKGDKFHLSIYGDVSITGSNVITEKTGESVRLTISSHNLTIGEEINETFPIRVVDLTQMFQAGNEPSTIEEFNARVATLGIDMYAYNDGQVIHCNTESIKSVGDNAWDEEWERGDINLTTGVKMESNDYLRTKNYIDILPNCEYAVKGVSVGRLLYYDADLQFIGKSDSFLATTIKTFLTPANARYMMYRWEGATYNNDIMITLVHSGWKQDTDAGYQPYWQDTLPLPIVRKYFPDGMKSVGSAHDEIRFNKASGKWEAVQRIGMFDKWEGRTISNADNPNLYAFPTGMLAGAVTPKAGEVICIHEKYEGKSQNTLNATESNGIAVYTSMRLWIKDMDVTSDPEALITKLIGTKLYYELAEPIVTELDAEDQNFRDYYNVADFGTEQSQSEVPSAAFSADIIYQFNAVDMIREHEIEITELQKVIATMQAQLASLTSNNA